MSEAKDMLYDESYRDTISTVDKEGKRVWIFPKKPKGDFTKWRTYVSWFLLAFLFAGPFIKINGQPLLLLNVLERKFVVFGVIFWPQDFYLVVLALITMIVFIALFTVVYGRIFCGWVCPQTIFMEMVFRKIEYWIEGDFMKQKALKRASWTTEKIFKRIAKHTIFFAISFFISNTFLAYIIGVEELKILVTDGPFAHLGTFSAVVIFSGVFYFIFAWFREQVCTIACPYGRLQGVLLDKKTVVVAYDYIRGEPRGKLRKKEERTLGDCIDCHQCVQVCPTGIDIRNGTQLECVNCTACIDACDNIMDKIDKPRGLIRYESEEGVAERKPFTLKNARVIAYSIILVGLVITLTSLMMFRSDVEATILRTPGMLYQKHDDGTIGNLYDFTVINKTMDQKPLSFEILSPEGEIEMVGVKKSMVEPQGKFDGKFFVTIKRENLESLSTRVTIGVFSDGVLITKEKTKFLGPPK